MSESDLTEQQKTDLLKAISKWRTDKKAIEQLELDDLQKRVKLLKLDKDFLDQHHPISLYYECSGRGLPASSYHLNINHLKNFYNSNSEYKTFVNDDYLAKIKDNQKRYLEGRKELDKLYQDLDFMTENKEKHSKTKTSLYRRVYIAHLITTGVNTVPLIMEKTGMPRRTTQDTIKALPELSIELHNDSGTYTLLDWGMINQDWLKNNLQHVINVLS